MNHFVRGLGYLMTASGQALSVILAAYYGGEYLKHNYSAFVYWDLVVWPLAILAVGHGFFVIIKNYSKLERINDDN